MEAIKKKMQALKIEKDNAMDRAEAAENQLRDSNIRVEKVAIKTQVLRRSSGSEWFGGQANTWNGQNLEHSSVLKATR